MWVEGYPRGDLEGDPIGLQGCHKSYLQVAKVGHVGSNLVGVRRDNERV